MPNPISLMIFVSLAFLASCQEDNGNIANSEPAIRGLKTIVIRKQEEKTVRRYPSVLQPAEITTLSFETAGKLGPANLSAGSSDGQNG